MKNYAFPCLNIFIPKTKGLVLMTYLNSQGFNSVALIQHIFFAHLCEGWGMGFTVSLMEEKEEKK